MRELPQAPGGHNKETNFMRTLLDCIRERTPLKSDAYGLDQTVNGWRINPKPSRGGSGSLEQRMIIKEIHDDWFLCLPYDKDGQHPALDVATVADYIKVAKPYELRLTAFDGKTVDGITFDYSDESHRTATKGTIIEQHVIVRPWYIGEIIVAATQITGGTDQEDFNAKALEWEDTNSASHAWAMVDINDTGGITPASLNVRSVSALLPILSSGGTRPQISLKASGVTPGPYGDAANVPSFTVDAFGRLTEAEEIPISASAGPPTGRWDFNGITAAHSSRKAWVGDTATPSSDDPATLIAAGTELNDAEYLTLHAEDSSGTDFTSGGSVTPFFLFKFLVNAQPLATKISTRGIVRMGVGQTSSIVLQIWNGVAWAGIGTVVADEDNWVMLGDARESLLADVIDSNGFLWLMLSTSVDTTLGIDYLAVDIETAAAPNGEAGPGGTGSGAVTAGYYARSNGTTFEDGNLLDLNTGTLQGTYQAGNQIVEGFTLFGNEFNLTADDMIITQGSARLVLSSDDAVAANRTFHLADGGGGIAAKNDGFRLLLQWRGPNAGELLASDSNLNLPGGNWTPLDGEFLEVIWDVPTQTWIELWRRP